MASTTLQEARKSQTSPVVRGITNNMVVADALFQFLPFDLIDSEAIEFNQVNAIGGAGYIAVDDDIPASSKSPTTRTKSSVRLKRLVGDAVVSSFIGDVFGDEVSEQVAWKPEGVGRTFAEQMIVGDGTGENITGFQHTSIVPAANIRTAGTNGDALSLTILDDLMSQVESKNGIVDALMMPRQGINKLRALLRAAGGNTEADYRDLPDGTGRILTYNGAVVLRNDRIPTSETKGTGTGLTSIYAFNWDDGSRKVGISGVTSARNMGISVRYAGIDRDKDNDLYRVGFNNALVNFNTQSVMRAQHINVQ